MSVNEGNNMVAENSRDCKMFAVEVISMVDKVL